LTARGRAQKDGTRCTARSGAAGCRPCGGSLPSQHGPHRVGPGRGPSAEADRDSRPKRWARSRDLGQPAPQWETKTAGGDKSQSSGAAGGKVVGHKRSGRHHHVPWVTTSCHALAPVGDNIMIMTMSCHAMCHARRPPSSRAPRAEGPCGHPRGAPPPARGIIQTLRPASEGPS
jgi:hypothetical protein